jgi:hypothetical protein
MNIIDCQDRLHHFISIEIQRRINKQVPEYVKALINDDSITWNTYSNTYGDVYREVSKVISKQIQYKQWDSITNQYV